MPRSLTILVVAFFVVAVAWVVLSVGRVPVPGIAYSLHVTSNPRNGPLAESPDGRAFAYAVWNSNERDAIGFNSWPLTTGAPLVVSRSFDLYVYDLVARGAPRRILRWTDADVDHTSLFCWSPDGIIVRRGPEPYTPWLVDPSSGHAQPMVPWSEQLLGRLYNDAHRIDTRVIPETRFHPELDVDRFFLWNPAAHRREWLFDLPLEYDGHPARFAAQKKQYRAEHEQRASFHEVGTIGSDSDGDSLYLSVFAYAREPGPAARLYRLVVHLDVPDTAGWREHSFGSRPVLIDSVVVRCPPDTITLRRSYSLRQLASYIRAIRGGGGEVYDGIWHTGVEAELRALPIPGEPATMFGTGGRANSLNAGPIEVPLGHRGFGKQPPP